MSEALRAFLRSQPLPPANTSIGKEPPILIRANYDFDRDTHPVLRTNLKHVHIRILLEFDADDSLYLPWYGRERDLRGRLLPGIEFFAITEESENRWLESRDDDERIYRETPAQLPDLIGQPRTQNTKLYESSNKNDSRYRNIHGCCTREIMIPAEIPRHGHPSLQPPGNRSIWIATYCKPPSPTVRRSKPFKFRISMSICFPTQYFTPLLVPNVGEAGVPEAAVPDANMGENDANIAPVGGGEDEIQPDVAVQNNPVGEGEDEIQPDVAVQNNPGGEGEDEIQPNVAVQNNPAGEGEDEIQPNVAVQDGAGGGQGAVEEGEHDGELEYGSEVSAAHSGAGRSRINRENELNIMREDSMSNSFRANPGRYCSWSNFTYKWVQLNGRDWVEVETSARKGFQKRNTATPKEKLFLCAITADSNVGEAPRETQPHSPEVTPWHLDNVENLPPKSFVWFPSANGEELLSQDYSMSAHTWHAVKRLPPRFERDEINLLDDNEDMDLTLDVSKAMFDTLHDLYTKATCIGQREFMISCRSGQSLPTYDSADAQRQVVAYAAGGSPLDRILRYTSRVGRGENEVPPAIQDLTSPPETGTKQFDHSMNCMLSFSRNGNMWDPGVAHCQQDRSLNDGIFCFLNEDRMPLATIVGESPVPGPIQANAGNLGAVEAVPAEGETAEGETAEGETAGAEPAEAETAEAEPAEDDPVRVGPADAVPARFALVSGPTDAESIETVKKGAEGFDSSLLELGPFRPAFDDPKLFEATLADHEALDSYLNELCDLEATLVKPGPVESEATGTRSEDPETANTETAGSERPEPGPAQVQDTGADGVKTDTVVHNIPRPSDMSQSSLSPIGERLGNGEAPGHTLYQVGHMEFQKLVDLFHYLLSFRSAAQNVIVVCAELTRRTLDRLNGADLHIGVGILRAYAEGQLHALVNQNPPRQAAQSRVMSHLTRAHRTALYQATNEDDALRMEARDLLLVISDERLPEAVRMILFVYNRHCQDQYLRVQLYRNDQTQGQQPSGLSPQVARPPDQQIRSPQPSNVGQNSTQPPVAQHQPAVRRGVGGLDAHLTTAQPLVAQSPASQRTTAKHPAVQTPATRLPRQRSSLQQSPLELPLRQQPLRQQSPGRQNQRRKLAGTQISIAQLESLEALSKQLRFGPHSLQNVQNVPARSVPSSNVQPKGAQPAGNHSSNREDQQRASIVHQHRKQPKAAPEDPGSGEPQQGSSQDARTRAVESLAASGAAGSANNSDPRQGDDNQAGGSNYSVSPKEAKDEVGQSRTDP